MTIDEALKSGRDICICPDCAQMNGGVWPKDHVATFCDGYCDVCNDVKVTCALSDWQWPAKKGGKAMERRRET